MAKTDARESLEIYKRFAKQTEAIIDYLSMAKRLQRDLQIEIPIGKHVCIQSYSGDVQFALLIYL